MNNFISECLSLSNLDDRRQEIKQEMELCRSATIKLFQGIDYETFCFQAHPDFSPIGWHLGHIAFIESLWLLEKFAQLPPLFPQYRRLFAADGLPKKQRGNLPSLEETIHYLDTVRTQVFHYLETADLEQQERLWRWLIQHESQHSETITFVLQLQGIKINLAERSPSSQVLTPSTPPDYDMVQIPAGKFEMGNDSIEALDNERLVHRVYLDTYYIDRFPVTCGQYRAFIEAGGYHNQNLWSDSGWEWLQKNPLNQPRYWTSDRNFDYHPVCGVSWYEAEAYAQFAGKRLPTEAEWEKAVSWDATLGCRRTYPWGEATPDDSLCNHNNIVGQTTPVNAYPNAQSFYGLYDTLGNVWEWTSSWFDGYAGFISYPYIGYSQVYFDGQHRVLRGGSWATSPWGLRASFRNWYHPHVREILAGFRCASS
ncbi:MAG: ergothioneine biosynthesis protein EgtB [Crinalium sp.]